MIKGGDEKNRISRPVVKISILSIALGVFVMILTLSIVTGFKNQVRDKVIGFGSHVQIMRAGGLGIFESEPMYNDHAMMDLMRSVDGVRMVSPVAYLPGIFQSKGDTVQFSLADGRDTFRLQQEIRGVMFKGVDSNYDFKFFEQNLVEGRILDFSDSSSAFELLVSKKVAQQMQYKIGDRIPVYFVQDQPFRRNFEVVGIFETGLEDFDNELAITKLPTVQRLSSWGVESWITLDDTLHNDRLLLRVEAKGGSGFHRHDWGDGFGMVNKYAFVPTKDTTIQVITSTYRFSAYEDMTFAAVPDTAWFKVTVKGDVYSGPPEMDGDKIKKNYLDEDGFKYSIKVGTATIIFEEIHGKGSAQNYISGYEILINSWEQLETTGEAVRKEMIFYSMENENPVDIQTIREVYGDIFSWLDFLDINFSIIIILMIVISVITMGASLLVLILEKTSAIGLMKAMGARDWTVRKIFLYQAGYLILRGMLWGNIFGVSVALLQMYFNIFPLDPAVYYLNAVPIEINWLYLILLNAFTIAVCVLVLIVPSYFVTRIRPNEAIKFS
jgi:lipoprotein-releasing system permease protein